MYKTLASLFPHCKRVLLATHTNPDGDAIGSMYALGFILTSLGVDIRLYNQSGIPQEFSWVQAPTRAYCARSLESLGDWTPDCLVLLDCGDGSRAGAEIAALLQEETRPKGWRGLVTVNIDHHLGNPMFAEHNWVEPQSAATGELVAVLAQEMGVPLSGALGAAVYLALVTDTGNFSYASTSSRVFSLAANILDHGLLVGPFMERLDSTWSLGRLHLWGALFQKVELLCNGAVAISVVPRAVVYKHNATQYDLSGYASWLRHLAGVQINVLIREEGEGCRFSLRSQGGINIQPVAKELGGGGHAAAAGGHSTRTPEKLRDALLPLLQALLQQGKKP